MCNPPIRRSQRPRRHQATSLTRPHLAFRMPRSSRSSSTIKSRFPQAHLAFHMPRSSRSSSVLKSHSPQVHLASRVPHFSWLQQHQTKSYFPQVPSTFNTQNRRQGSIESYAQFQGIASNIQQSRKRLKALTLHSILYLKGR